MVGMARDGDGSKRLGAGAPPHVDEPSRPPRHVRQCCSRRRREVKGLPRPMRRILLWMVLVAEIGLFGWLIARHSDPALVGYDDFISSWAAGRLNAFGQNPYDPALVLALQRTVGWTEVIPYRIWYPPWAIPLLEPFGMLPHHTGRMVWWFVHILALGVSADLLWRYFGGPRHLRAASWIVMITFWPAVADLVTGQVSAFMLLGIAGFLSLERSGRPMAAGAVLP